jgi:alginate O-acetyltransferase complex protein AlgF
MRNRILIAVTLCLLGVSLCARAPADSLYGAEAPKDAAFVRFFRAAGGGGPVELGAKRFDPAVGEVTPYRPVLPDIYLLRSGGQETEIIPKVGHYYTLVVAAEGIRIFEDVEHTDPARAQLVLYNLLPSERVELKTADGRTSVIAGVGPGEAGRVNVNAIPVKLGVFGSAGPLGMLGDPGLQRGASYSAFVFETGSSPRIVWAKAELAKK